MPVVIEFDYVEDHERALDILFNIEATYSGAGRGRILVPETAARTLQERGVRYRIVAGRRLEGEPHGTTT